ncbi:MAG: efflux RND transporter permease subunit, partial [Chromatiaceae bacterium]
LWGSFLFTCSFFYFNWVAVKMLPLDNKPEFSVVLDMPEGSALPVTANLAHRMAEKLRTMPEVTAIQLYAGAARPFDFNGMVRHYYLRSEPWQAELQIQLTDKHDRKRTSHEIAVDARELLTKLAEGTGATVSVVEMPPGPPVMQSVVAEIHGPTPELRRQFARDLTGFFKQAESTRDVDNYLRGAYDYWRFDVDTEKAVRRGISVDTINRNLAMALGGAPVGDIKQTAGQQSGHEPIQIVIQVPLAERSQIQSLGDLPIQSSQGFTVPLRELGAFRKAPEEDIIFHKDLRGVEFVVADVGGRLAAPVYAMFQIQDLIKEANYTAPDGTKPAGGDGLPDAFYWFGPPSDDSRLSWEWAGEWTVTYETFRDMGAAFMVALVLIYILVVWEFGNFRIPLVIMAPIPLTLLGIIPAHSIMFQLGLGGEFTATSMIGWIALAGIIVRNSILLVDFAIHEIQRGIPVAEAMIRSCKIRTRPILITALALVAGSSVIITDPIFQGMAISLLAGTLVSTVLTLIVIPLGCVAASRDMCEVAAASAGELPVSGLPCQVEAAEQAAAKPKREGAGLSGALAKVAEVLSLVFYAVRGIFLLLMDMAKSALKPKAPPKAKPKPKSKPGAPPQGSGSPGPGAPPAPTPVAPASAAPVVSAPAASASAAGLGTPGAEVAEGSAKAQGAAPAQASETPVPADAPRSAPQAREEAAEKSAAPAQPVRKPSPQPSVSKSNGDDNGSGGGKTTAAKKPNVEVRAAAKSTQPAMPSVQKKAPRRGIRLKIDDGASGEDI